MDFAMTLSFSPKPLMRPFPTGCAAIAAVLMLCASTARAQASESAITCTNPASGASWQIKIDYAKSAVDANAASISDATISWRDAKDLRNYTLDRKTGKLTVILASATGGNFLYAQCKLDGSG
jgi:hypothetical protein